MRRSRSAFSLVELLVAISLMMFLMAMLLPALGKTRQLLVTIVCETRLSGIMQATLHYANDNDDHLPFPNWGGNGVDCCGWDDGGWLYHNKTGTGYTTADWQSQAVRESGLIYPYMNATDEGYRCPNDPPPYYKGGHLSSYCMNGSVANYGAKYTYAVIHYKSDSIIYWEVEEDFGEGGINNGGWWDGSNFPHEGMTNDRHQEGGAVVNIDTTVQWMLATEYWAEEAKEPGRLWNVPDSGTGKKVPD